MSDILDNLLFIFERLTWLSALDLFLVTLIFGVILFFLRDTQAMLLVRGIIFLIVLISLLTSLLDLPAFTWLVSATLPALVVAIPVVFAAEIRRGLERLGRASNLLQTRQGQIQTSQAVSAIVRASGRLSNRRHGALIVLQRLDSLDEYIQTGTPLNGDITPEILLQIFYPHTPLHDGAAILSGDKLIAAACVMPLSASGVLSASSERKLGLRHRAALGISEVSDAVSIIISEETGNISITTGGRMIQRIDPERLEGVLQAMFEQPKPGQNQLQKLTKWVEKFFSPNEPQAES